MPKPEGCEAIIQHDEYFCAGCGLRWGKDSAFSPDCKAEQDRRFGQPHHGHESELDDRAGEDPDPDAFHEHKAPFEIYDEAGTSTGRWEGEGELNMREEPRSLPEGVTAVSLGDPEELHNTIAEAVGEPSATPKGPKYPDVVYFEKLGTCFYSFVGQRAPRKDEYYLSGAVVMGYRARKDMRSIYWVVKPQVKAVKKTIYVAGEQIV